MGLFEDLGLDALLKIAPMEYWMYFLGVLGMLVLVVFFLAANNVFADLFGEDRMWKMMKKVK